MADEARAVVELVPAERRTLLLGAAASVDAVLSATGSDTSRLRVVHFACHGIVDPVRARGSGLLLAGGDVLDVDRLARTRVPADLVVLSACASARGKVAQGEGLSALRAGGPAAHPSAWAPFVLWGRSD